MAVEDPAQSFSNMGAKRYAALLTAVLLLASLQQTHEADDFSPGDISPPPGFKDNLNPLASPHGVLGTAYRRLRPQAIPPSNYGCRSDGGGLSKMSADRRHGSLYVTKEDFVRAGVEYDSDASEHEQDWGGVWNAKRDLWEPEEAEDPDMQALLTDEPVLKRGRKVAVMGLAFDGTFDEETTSLMQMRLAIERADHDCLKAALHNAAELDEWTERLDEAFHLGRMVLNELTRKEDFRVFFQKEEDTGVVLPVLSEDILGYRHPEGTAAVYGKTGATRADMLLGPRDAHTRLRIDPKLTMEENYALWDALESQWLKTDRFPEIANLTFYDAYKEAVYQEKAQGEVITWPNVDAPWHVLQKTALLRAEEALADPDHGEVGSAWYHASPAENHTAEMYPKGAWWYVNGNVERKPDMLWRNGQYVWDDEPLDENKWKDSVHCPTCEFEDCGYAEGDIERMRDLRLYNSGALAPTDTEFIRRIATLPKASLDARLCRACRRANTTQVLLLLAAGADPNCQDPHPQSAGTGLQPLHLAAEAGAEPVVHALITAGAKIDARTKVGATPMHIAAHMGGTPVIQCLVKLGADIDSACDRGYTPLMEAAEECHNYTVSKMLQLGADPWIRNENEDLALNFAERRYAQDLSMLLRKAMDLPLCKCHGCAGFTTGSDNTAEPHITDPGSPKNWEDTYTDEEWYPKDFWDIMKEEEDKVDDWNEKLAEVEPYGRGDALSGIWERLNSTWFDETADKAFTGFWLDYHRRYADKPVLQPAPEALEVYERLSAREKEEDARRDKTREELEGAKQDAREATQGLGMELPDDLGDADWERM